MNNPLLFTDPSGYRPDLIFEEEQRISAGQDFGGGGGGSWDPFGWINRYGHAGSVVDWTMSNAWTYWVKNIKGNELLNDGEASESFFHWYQNRNSISLDGSRALSQAMDFYYNNNDGDDYWHVSSLGKIYTGKTKLSDLIQQYHDIVLTASTGPMPFPFKAVSLWSKTVARYLRNTLFLAPGLINPFYRAEAILGDIGFAAMVEGDVGGAFVLKGKDQGKFVSYYELGWGVTVDLSAGVEFVRADLTGRPSQFEIALLKGPRMKLFASAVFAGMSLGGSFAWTGINDLGGRMVFTGVSLGISIPLYSPLGGIGGGINNGETIIPSLPK